VVLLARAHTGSSGDVAFRRGPRCLQACSIEGSPLVKNLVYGGLDGTLATFAITSAVVGAGLPWTVCLVMGSASLAAEAISMGLGDWYSTRAADELAENERAREEWEYDNHIEGERKELEQLLCARGVPTEDAHEVVAILSKHRTAFVDLMLTQELGIQPPDGGESATRGALVTFFSFLVFGSTPIITFCLLQHAAGEYAMPARNVDFALCCLATAATTFILGVAKAAVTGGSLVKGGLQMDVNAAIAGGMSFLVSSGMNALMISVGIATGATSSDLRTL